MKRLNHGVCRMGLEWSRIEPEKGVFDDSAMEHYRSEIRLLLDSGIKPLVTLHHFSHPMWFVREGEFESASCVRSFERYVRYVVGKLGDLVEEYITINEPNVFKANGYFFGDWPPGKKDFRLAMRVMKNMSLCHIAAYKAIHEIRSERGFPGRTMVGVANHLRVFDPISKNPLDYLTARLMQYLFQDGEHYTFMDNATYEQVLVDKEAMGETTKWLQENLMCTILFWNGRPISVSPFA
jgi:beta-glucosidase